MDINDIPKLSLEVTKRNLALCDNDNDLDALSSYDTLFDINKLPNLTGEREAADLLSKVMDDHGFILAVSDYDSDGLNSAAVVYKALKSKYDNYKVIHNKRCHHNGFNPVLIDKIKKIHDEKPIDLMYTMDHGSNDKEAFEELKNYGIKHIIVTDHHMITKGKEATNADVFINAQQFDNDPKHMCGCYVTFKVMSSLYKDDPDIYNNFYRPCLPHVAIATVSDVMSLNIWYNRVAVRAGLQLMNIDQGLWKLLGIKLGLPAVYRYKDIGYSIAPFINTGNRSSTEELCYEILVTEDIPKLSYLIDQGIKNNIRRKEIKKHSLAKVMDGINVTKVGKSLSIIMECSMSINGIVANAVGESFRVPTTCFVLDKENKTLSGSSRAVLSHVSIADTYNKMKELDSNLFHACGGHKGAGGCCIDFDKFDRFQELFEKVISELPVPDKDDVKDIVIDYNTKYLDYSVIEDIDFAGPYGKDWIMPKLRGMFKVDRVIHTKALAIFTLRGLNGKLFKATYFYPSNETILSLDDLVPTGAVVDVIFEPQYYKRYNATNFTLLIDTIQEVTT